VLLDQEGFFQRVCEALGTDNVQQIANKTGIKKQSVYLWQKGGWPSLDNLGLIAESSSTSLHWLLTGKGEKYLGECGTTVAKKLAPGERLVDTAPAPILIPEIGLPTAPHQLQLAPLQGTISGQKIVGEESRVLVPGSLVDEASVLFRIEGDDLAAEGLHDGDILIARPAAGDVEGKVVIALVASKVLVRHYTTTKKLALLSPIEGNRPVIKAPVNSVEVKYIVTSITRSFH